MRILRALKPLRRPPRPRATALAVGLFLMGAGALPVSTEARFGGEWALAANGPPAFASVSVQPTAVVIRSFSAKRVGTRTVRLRWRTGFEADLVGFDLFRRRGKRVVRLNKLSVPARNATGGASYTYVDRSAKRGLAQYRLEAVELDGTRVWAGSVSVR
jgi:hypothetical protein